MAIFHVRFERPVPIEPEYDMREQVLDAFISKNRQIEEKPEGIYDVTPEGFENPSFSHQLTVLSDGRGMYTLMPTRSGSVYILERSTDMTLERKTAKRVLIPEDNDCALIFGLLKNSIDMVALYSLVSYRQNTPTR